MRFIKSLSHAIRGVFLALKSERNLQIHAVVAVLVCIAGVVFGISRWEWCILFICFALVIAAEMANTAIEKMLNFIHPDKHDAVRDIKDIAAGMVLVTSIIAVIVGILVFLPVIKCFIAFRL